MPVSARKRRSRNAGLSPSISSEEIVVDTTELRKRLTRLKAKAEAPMGSMSNDDDLVKVVALIRQHDGPVVMNEVRSVFSDVRPIPGTVGGFFKGCILSSNPAQTCVVTCSSSNFDLGSCNKSIYVFDGTGVHRLQGGFNEAIVYMDIPLDDGKIPDLLRKQLIANGVSSADLVVFNGQTYIVAAQYKASAGDMVTSFIQNATKSPKSAGMTVLYVVIAIIVIAIAIGLIMMVGKS